MKTFTFVVLLSLANFVLAVPVADKTSDGTLIEAASGKKSAFQNVHYVDYYNYLPAGGKITNTNNVAQNAHVSGGGSGEKSVNQYIEYVGSSNTGSAISLGKTNNKNNVKQSSNVSGNGSGAKSVDQSVFVVGSANTDGPVSAGKQTNNNNVKQTGTIIGGGSGDKSLSQSIGYIGSENTGSFISADGKQTNINNVNQKASIE